MQMKVVLRGYTSSADGGKLNNRKPRRLFCRQEPPELLICSSGSAGSPVIAGSDDSAGRSVNAGSLGSDNNADSAVSPASADRASSDCVASEGNVIRSGSTGSAGSDGMSVFLHSTEFSKLLTK